MKNPTQSDTDLDQIVKALSKTRKKPVLLMKMDTVTPVSVKLVLRELEDKEIDDLDVVLHTPGGHIESSYKIVKLLRKHSKNINIIVPSYAKSAGTLICLSADNLILTTTSELGPLDVQISEKREGDIDDYKSALDGYKSLEQIQKHSIETLDVTTQLLIQRTGGKMRLQDIIKMSIEFSGHNSSALYRQVNPKNIAGYARSLEVGEKYGVKILTKYMKWNQDKATKVVRHLVYDYPSHSFIIDFEEINGLGFAVEEAKDEMCQILNTLGIVLDARNNNQENEIKFFDYKKEEEAQKVKKTSGKKNKNDKAKRQAK